MKLYEIPAEFDALWQQIEAAESEEQLSGLEAQFRVMLQESTAKVEAAAKVVKALVAERDFAKEEAERLSERAAAVDRNIKRLQDLMLYAVDTAFNGKVKTPLFSIWGQTSAETIKFDVAPDCDLMKLPATFVRVTADLNRKALAEAFKQGQPIPDEVIAIPQAGTRFLRIK